MGDRQTGAWTAHPDPAGSRPQPAATRLSKPGQASGARPRGRGGGLPTLTPSSAAFPSAAAFQSRWPASASRRHPRRRDSRNDAQRDRQPRPLSAASPPARPRRACAHTPDPGAGLAGDTCDQQVSRPRPPASGGPAPRAGPAHSSRPAPPPPVNSQLSCG